MTTNANVKPYAEQLAGILTQIADLKAEAKDILASAKEAGVNAATLNKVAREMAMSSDKLAKKLEGEVQLSLFRGDVGLLKLKGLQDLGFEGLAA